MPKGNALHCSAQEIAIAVTAFLLVTTHFHLLAIPLALINRLYSMPEHQLYLAGCSLKCLSSAFPVSQNEINIVLNLLIGCYIQSRYLQWGAFLTTSSVSCLFLTVVSYLLPGGRFWYVVFFFCKLALTAHVDNLSNLFSFQKKLFLNFITKKNVL